MPFIQFPHLPEGRVTLAAVSEKSCKTIKALQHLGIHVIPISTYKTLAQPVHSHADMLCHPCGNNQIILAKGCCALKSILASFGFDVLESATTLQERYPKDVGLNAFYLNEYTLIGKTEGLDKVVMEACRQKRIEVQDTKQGYAKCSTVLIRKNAIITADDSIETAAKQAGADVLKIQSGFVELPGYAYGFLGGASGMIDKSICAFAGTLETHPDAVAIQAFLSKYKIKALNLWEGPLVDVGGIIPLKTE